MKHIKERSEFLNESKLNLGLSTNEYPAGTVARYRLESDVINLRKVANLAKEPWAKYSRAFTDNELGFESGSDRRTAMAAIQKSFDSGRNDLKEFSLNESKNSLELNEGWGYNELLAIHFETDPKKQEELKKAYGKKTGAMSSSAQIDSANYALKKLRKEINYDDKGTDVDVFLPGSYSAAISTLGNGPHKKVVKPKSWNQREYDKWIKDMAGNDGWKHAYDMAQNAKLEPGLIDWVRKNNRGEDPLQRIQWDIEAHTP